MGEKFIDIGLETRVQQSLLATRKQEGSGLAVSATSMREHWWLLSTRSYRHQDIGQKPSPH